MCVHSILTSLIWSGTIHPIMVVLLIEKVVPLTWWFNRKLILLLRIPFSLINATQILFIANLPSCSLDRYSIPTTTQTVESKFIIKSIKNRVKNSAYHQKSINSWIISGAAGNKSQKSGRSRGARENSTLPPKPRAEGSSPSAPAIGKKSVDALQQGICGLFLCQNRPIGHALKIPDFRGKILETPQYSWIFQRLPSGTSSKKHQPISGKARFCTACRGWVTGGEKKCIFFVQPCCVDKNTWLTWLWLSDVIEWV